jgi:aprataxin
LLADSIYAESAFSVLMQSSKNSATKSLALETKSAGGWAGALAPYVLTPEKFPDVVYHHDDRVVVIYDKFPKAKFHFLVMPRAIVDGFRALNSSCVPMLKDMKLLADKIVKKYAKIFDCWRFFSHRILQIGL